MFLSDSVAVNEQKVLGLRQRLCLGMVLSLLFVLRCFGLTVNDLTFNIYANITH